MGGFHSHTISGREEGKERDRGSIPEGDLFSDILMDGISGEGSGVGVGTALGNAVDVEEGTASVGELHEGVSGTSVGGGERETETETERERERERERESANNNLCGNNFKSQQSME